MKTDSSFRGRMPALLINVLSLVVLFNGRVHAQNLLQDGGFELGIRPPGTYYSDLTYGAWTAVNYTHTYLVGTPFDGVPANEGGEAIWLRNTGAGGVTQSFATEPGRQYLVTLSTHGGVETGSGTVAVKINGGNIGLPAATAVWTTNTYGFTASTSATDSTLLIANGGGDAIIDDVRVTLVPLLLDGGFELGITAGPNTYASRTTYGAWSAVGSPTTFLFGMPSGVTPAYEGKESLLIGNGGTAGFVTQSFATAIGQTYWVSFALNVADAGNGTARVMAFTPSQTNLLQNFAAPGSSQWGVASYSFIASGTTTTLRLQNVSGACIIDDVRLATTPRDMALKFDGVNDFVRITNFGTKMPTNQITIEFWQRVRSVKAQSTFSCNGNSFNAHIPWVDGKIYWDFGNSVEGRLTYTPPISIVGTWQHFALIAKSDVGGGVDYLNIVRNGIIEAQKIITGTLRFTPGNFDLLLGTIAGANYFDGELDEVRIWNVARNVIDIRADMNKRLTGLEPGLVAYYRMDEASDSLVVVDSSFDVFSTPRNGVLTNGVMRVGSTVPPCGVSSIYTNGSMAMFEGYQPYVKQIATALVPSATVTNLCYDIAPASGTAGVELTDNNAHLDLTLNYSGGLWSTISSGNNAAGLRVRSGGADGGVGNFVPGGNAGSSTVNSSGNLFTSGNTAAGIHAISQGGAGGPGENYTVENGDHGGNGGRGGSSTVNSTSSILTSGASAPGIFAVSQGGAGGKGGNSTFFSGAYGGVGGSAGSATITGSGNITTTGAHAMGVLALSQAGQGGNGGSGDSFGNGGSGNYGGDAGAAKVDGSWTITTLGSNAVGMSARSLGGAGGQAGNGTWASLVSGGGGGGSGSGSSATVNLGLGGSINTYGREAHGILAQSIGGFAGGGGDSGLLIGSAGSGGSAGDGGNVTVTNQGTIITRGIGANAIFAESVGGGGGSGGSGGLFTASGAPQAGGDGGQVTVNNQGQLVTSNHNAGGIFAQSVGGSGGSGATDLGLFYSVGGAGGQGGNGDTVTVVNSGSIITKGTNASGIFAQSVGGGGGKGGGSANVGGFGSVSIGGSGGVGGDGAFVNVTNTSAGSVNTAGDNAHGIFAQSVGGGGGDGGFAIAASGGEAISGSVGIGGSGATGGNGSNVVVTSSSGITTAGTNAHGIFAQSVGGGGGAGGFSVSVAGSDGAAVSLSLGGNAAKGGNGQTVNVTQQNSANLIQTEGDHSYGILAQSVGGGGGDGGFSVAGVLAGGAAVPLSFGGSGAAGGLGGNVTVINGTAISTKGKDAHGIFAQSVGGGGGSGGFSVSGGISGGASVGASFGGSGGGGSSAGSVSVTHRFRTINTSNDHSYGILAQSIGGGGGDGGFSVAGGIGGGAAVNFAMGGSGGAGGVAGNVNVNTLLGSITTAGSNSHALFAQSVGGGGGSGGFSVAGGIAGGPSVSVGIGGGAGSGASASNVTVTTVATGLHTSGERAYGILAQSVGGGGGDGGFSVAGGIGGGPSVNFAMGGSGGAGGTGGNVLVNSSSSSITTSNLNSHAIFAQSVGGGGGSGGFSVGAGISSSAAVSVGIGGNGGSGANASNVTVNSTGAMIRTDGDRSYGLLAQSVGGGGGDGGFSVAGGISSAPSVNFAMGGSGGVAGNGATVAVTNRTAITTHGQDSHGIFAQSVGGGGGSGGFSVAGGISGSGAAISASIGGGGNNGGVAGNVTLTNSGAITTTGNRAYGMLAQSVGGGGGDGGFSVAGGIGQGPAITFSLGGGAGPGGRGASVDLANSGNIYTGGELAYGLFGQSVGGGGGSGGFSVAGSLSANSLGLAFGLGGSAGSGADAARVNVVNTGNIETTNKGSHAIMAQSVGGGGGAGGFGGALAGGFGNGANLSVGVGGTGGFGGNASNVVVRSTGSNTVTRGVASYGIFAQSVGGGGGDGGAGLAASIGSQSKSVNLALGIGRSGGTGGIGGDVAVDSSSTIRTEGIVSHGIVAQSIGGGGGNGGFSVAGSLSTSTNAKQLSVSIGGSGGGGGSAGNVNVTNSGRITTLASITGGIPDYGTNLVKVPKIPVGSVGILAQSIGGGGGNGGTAYSGTFAGTGAKNISVAIGGGGGDGNFAGNVLVQNSGLIETWGDNSHGILAQSIGGGGGNGGEANALAADVSGETESWNVNIAATIGGGGGDGGIGGSVQVANSSNIVTHGKSAHAILAQSIGGGGGNGGASVAITGGFDYNTNVFNASAAIGGGGGEGNHGGRVDVVNQGSIETYEDASYGIFAQSVGGGGGVGGSARALSVTVELKQLLINPFTDWKKYFSGFSQTLNLSVGGDGGGASDGGIVSVTNVGNIKTRGADAYGIFAQSIGGGGGIGGAALNGIPLDILTNVPGPLPADKIAEILLEGTALRSFGATQIVLGGDGGSSGNGNTSIVNNTGTIETLGDGAHGILAQSIGGGGGLGGLGAIGLVGKVGIGGGGGSAGNGGNVIVTQSGDIKTSGVTANGITAQSVGGGGGIGGSVDRGIANFGVNVAYGQGGGNAGNGGTVIVSSTGNITTSNRASYGVFAQSVGGGGGVAGSLGNLEIPWLLSFAGSTGGHGDGGQVTVAHSGDITTFGNASDGIFAQSAGGADIVTFSVGDLLDPATFVLMLKYQSNAVSTYVRGRLSTGTRLAVDGYTNSGLVSELIQTSLVSELNSIIHGVNIYDVTRFAGVTLRLETTQLKNQNPDGDDLVRLNRWLLEDSYPHELSGDFGAGNALGVGGDVDITVTGDITAHGTNANGIFAQSTGANGAGDITINILGSGTVHGGSGDSAGVRIEGGANNTLTNYGTITTLNGDPGVAFLGGTGNDRVENYGTMIGQVLLGGGVNSVSNHFGSIVNVETIFALGAGNVLNNQGLVRGSGQIIGDVVSAGAISPGNSAGALSIDGTLSLLASATVSLEIGGREQGVTYDYLSVSDFVSFLGTVSVSLTDSFQPTSSDSFTLMEFGSSSGGFSNVVGDRLLTADNSGSFRVTYNTNSLVVDDYSLDTDGDGMDDADEILAGTDWNDPLSVLAISSLVKDASGSVVIRFPWVTGKNYTIEYATNPGSAVWTEVGSPSFTFPGANTGQWIDDGTQTGGFTGANRFYRVKLLLPAPEEAVGEVE